MLKYEDVANIRIGASMVTKYTKFFNKTKRSFRLRIIIYNDIGDNFLSEAVKK